MGPTMLHPEFETLPSAEVLKLQTALWADQWRYVRANSAFYRSRYALDFPEELPLEALQDLPFTEKDDLRLSQERSYPFGEYLASPVDKVVRLHMTSGTTGRPLQLANSRKDVEWIARIGGRAFFSAGLRPGDRVVHCLNYCMWTGGLTDHMNLEETGACVVPYGVGAAEKLLETIEQLGITAISCTPSYPALLEKLLREKGKDPRDLNLRLGLFGGEAGLDNLEFRQNLENSWGFSVRNANYGMSEIMSIFGSQSELTNDLHFHAADAVFAELVDSNGRVLPIDEGVTGELVCTHLRKECQPLIRYRTRDVITVTGTGKAACGRTSWRFRVTGRTDDMFNVRGINVFPSAVQKAVMARPDISTGQFRILLRGEGPWDRIEMRVEAAPGLAKEDWPGAAHALEREVQRHAGASASVTLIDADSLARTAGKTNLIERV